MSDSFIQLWSENEKWYVLIRPKSELNEKPDSFFAWEGNTRDEALAFIQGLTIGSLNDVGIVEGIK